jgi:phosphoribosylformylglycinamidine (FGAM) synthase PurS component
MRKKLVLQRNLRRGGGGGAPYLKYLVIAALGLIFLVIITPYLVKQKSDDVTKRQIPEKGAITKELPKQPEQSPPARLPEAAKPAELPGYPETRRPETAMAPEPVKPPEVQPAPQPPEPVPAAPQRPPVEEAAPSQGKAAAPEKAPSDHPSRPAEPAPKDLFPKKWDTSEAPLTAAQKGPVKPEAKAGGPASSAKPAASAPSTRRADYAVQVGPVSIDKSQAQTVQKDLAAKGYKAVVRTVAHGCGYSVTTGAVTQSKAYTLLEQMKIQGLNNAKVIKVAPDSGPAAH